jgi:hypothetical protein
MIAAHERAFHVDFWNQGVVYGSGWVGDLTEAGRAVVAFHGDEASVEEMVLRFGWFKADRRGPFHERGAAYFVAEAWRILEDRLKKEKEDPFAAIYWRSWSKLPTDRSFADSFPSGLCTACASVAPPDTRTRKIVLLHTQSGVVAFASCRPMKKRFWVKTMPCDQQIFSLQTFHKTVDLQSTERPKVRKNSRLARLLAKNRHYAH